MYRWYCVHVVHVVLCACHTCYDCTHVVLCTCYTFYFVYVWYYVCPLHSLGIMTCVFMVLYFVYLHVLCCVVHRMQLYMFCCTSGVGVLKLK